MAPSDAMWTVTCPDFTKKFKTFEQAERWANQVEASGHCRHHHRIIEPERLAEATTPLGDPS